MAKKTAPRWHKGWPMKTGNYVVRLACGDMVAIQVRKFTSDDGEHYLDASDCMDSVCFTPPSQSELEGYWGKALAHFGPFPSYRLRPKAGGASC